MDHVEDPLEHILVRSIRGRAHYMNEAVRYSRQRAYLIPPANHANVHQIQGEANAQVHRWRIRSQVANSPTAMKEDRKTSPQTHQPAHIHTLAKCRTSAAPSQRTGVHRLIQKILELSHNRVAHPLLGSRCAPSIRALALANLQSITIFLHLRWAPGALSGPAGSWPCDTGS